MSGEIDPELAQELEQAQSGGYEVSGELRNPQATLSKWQLSVDQFLEILEHEFKGEKPSTWEDASGAIHVEWEDTGTGIMKEEGVDSLISFMRVCLDKIHTLSNYTRNDVQDACRWFAVKVVGMLFYNKEEWGVTAGNRDLILTTMVDSYESIRKRAMEGGEREAISMTQRIVQRLGGGDGEESGGGFMR